MTRVKSSFDSSVFWPLIINELRRCKIFTFSSLFSVYHPVFFRVKVRMTFALSATCGRMDFPHHGRTRRKAKPVPRAGSWNSRLWFVATFWNSYTNAKIRRKIEVAKKCGEKKVKEHAICREKDSVLWLDDYLKSFACMPWKNVNNKINPHK